MAISVLPADSVHGGVQCGTGLLRHPGGQPLHPVLQQVHHTQASQGKGSCRRCQQGPDLPWAMTPAHSAHAMFAWCRAEPLGALPRAPSAALCSLNPDALVQR